MESTSPGRPSTWFISINAEEILLPQVLGCAFIRTTLRRGPSHDKGKEHVRSSTSPDQYCGRDDFDLRRSGQLAPPEERKSPLPNLG